MQPPVLDRLTRIQAPIKIENGLEHSAEDAGTTRPADAQVERAIGVLEDSRHSRGK